MMFIGAFVVFESMVFLKKRHKRAGVEALAHEEPASIPAPGRERINLKINDINDSELLFFSIGVTMHCGIVLWAIWDLWALQALASQTAEEASKLHITGLTPRAIRFRQLMGLFFCVAVLVYGVQALVIFIWLFIRDGQYIIQLTIFLLGLGCVLGPVLYYITFIRK